ncbi:MAG TPA: hypothetical protein VHQ23_08700 [Ilumatobacteraceae bacterium]|nr:hypothetical protein [Ilumatobacteraceae bacterium]
MTEVMRARVEKAGRVKFAVVVGVVVSVVAVTGCGTSEVLVHSESARPIGETAETQCPIEYTTLATATEAYWASTGGPPSSEGELISAGMLREEVGGFDLLIGDDNYELIPVEDCTGFTPS